MRLEGLLAEVEVGRAYLFRRPAVDGAGVQQGARGAFPYSGDVFLVLIDRVFLVEDFFHGLTDQGL